MNVLTIAPDNAVANVGDITIRNGATVISRTTSNAFQRTGSTSAGTLTVDAGGILQFKSAAPKIAMTAIVFNGTVVYDNDTATVTQTMAVAVNGGASPNTYNNVSINNAMGVTLNGPVTVNGVLLMTGGDLDLNGNTLTLGSSGFLSESAGSRVKGASGVITTTRTLTAGSTENIAGLGVVITAAADPGSTVISRGHAIQTSGANAGIARYFDISPATNSGLDATLVFTYSEAELNSIPEPSLALYKSVDGGASWAMQDGTVDATNNTITVVGIDGFSRWTAANIDAPLPVQLASFSATANAEGGVVLRWVTASELNNYGFEVQRSAEKTTGYQTISGLLPGHGTSIEQHSYTFTDGVAGSTSWFYRLKQMDLSGGVRYYDPIAAGPLTSVRETAPAHFALLQNYPNPFNPTTVVSFQLPAACSVRLTVYDMLGREVGVLVNERMEPGIHSVSFDANGLAGGMYFYRLTAGENSSVKRMTVLK